MFPKSSPRRSPETPGVAKTPAEHLVSVQKSIQEGGKWISMGFLWDFHGISMGNDMMFTWLWVCRGMAPMMLVVLRLKWPGINSKGGWLIRDLLDWQGNRHWVWKRGLADLMHALTDLLRIKWSGASSRVLIWSLLWQNGQVKYRWKSSVVYRGQTSEMSPFEKISALTEFELLFIIG